MIHDVPVFLFIYSSSTLALQLPNSGITVTAQYSKHHSLIHLRLLKINSMVDMVDDMGNITIEIR